MQEPFTLWLEFEECERAGDHKPSLYSNVQVTFADGRRYALTVWLTSAVNEIVGEDADLNEPPAGQYSIGPDLLAARMERAFLKQVIAPLIRRGELNEQWRCDT